ncbi:MULTISPECIES: hypothetical protein [Streptomyces]|uniref:hypothetical protein n=1 Tax=Streptomyces TaxID=1883 RepID=UPI000899B2B0|nr:MULTISPECIES: hypothetical protein [unclassified Streptomyces]SEE08552.1 hypothetical protein SAMN05216482_9105 [Streptomyces sp. PAN_FS17]SEE70058.1 hypothetical protein SAMN05428938_8178 [Streptomyces sp. KS_5]
MDGTTCGRLVAREVEMPSGQREWVHGAKCGKPSLVQWSGQGVCADHIPMAWPLP